MSATMTSAGGEPCMRSRSLPDCPQCGAAGVALYSELPDRLFGTRGRWNLKRCPARGSTKNSCRTATMSTGEISMGMSFADFPISAGGSSRISKVVWPAAVVELLGPLFGNLL